MKTEKKVQSVIRSLDLLKALSESEYGMGVGMAAEILGVTSPAAHCLLRTLQSRGFVEKRGASYYLGGEVISLHNQYTSTVRMKRVKEVMLALTKEYPQATVNYTEVKGNHLMTVFRIIPEWPELIQTINSPGFNIYANLSGMVCAALLAEGDAFSLRQTYPFEQYGAAIWKTPEAYEKNIEKIRKDGFVFRNYTNENTFRAAVPVMNENKSLSGALGISIRYPSGTPCPNAKEGRAIVEHVAKKAGEI